MVLSLFPETFKNVLRSAPAGKGAPPKLLQILHKRLNEGRLGVYPQEGLDAR